MARFRTSCRAAIAALLIGATCASVASGVGGISPAGAQDDPGINPDGVDPLPPLPDDVALPIVFVHGFAGSAQQFESQAIRFAANGYPQDRIVAFDHDGAGLDIAGYTNGLDAVINDALERFDADKVYLFGHSRGTFVSSSYLGNAARAAKVAKYVSLDGSPCPTAVPCTAINQAGNPGQAHVEVATSKESFAKAYQFLIGEAPEVVDIVPQREPIELSGRAVNFPANTGTNGATLNVWEINPETGARVGDEPHATFEIGADGNWGPFTAEHGAYYEYVLSRPGSEVQHHLYLQPYTRSSQLVRLLSSEPDGPTRTNSNVGPNHSMLVTSRMREWYGTDDGDLPGNQTDVLNISTRGPGINQPPVNAIQARMGNGTIGLHFHDDAATPRQSTLAALPYFSTQPFQNGADVYMPASTSADAPDGTITVTNIPRGQADKAQTLNVPNWPSSRHAISVVFTDYPLDVAAPPAEAELVLNPATNHTDGQQVRVGGSNIPNTQVGSAYWFFETTGEWSVLQCGAGVEANVYSVFSNCAGLAEDHVPVQGGTLNANVTVNTAFTSVLDEEVDCTEGDGCVVALARLESDGKVSIVTAPLSFGPGSTTTSSTSTSTSSTTTSTSTSTTTSTTTTSTTAPGLNGAQIWAANCAACHGANGEGGVGPGLGAGTINNHGRAAVIEVITNGRGTMPAWGGQLSAAEIEAVTDHIATLSGSHEHDH